MAASYTYDGAGARVGATVSGTASTQLWDTADGLPQVVSDGATSYLQADGLQAAIGATGTTYPLTDALGSVRGVTDASGNLVGTTDYDVFGAVRSQSGTNLSFGFTGQLSDATGLVYLRARELDPSLGRFLSPDAEQPNAPGSQGYNLYAYVANNPTSWVDPSGRAIDADTVELIAPFIPTAISMCLASAGICIPVMILIAAVFLTIACYLVPECSAAMAQTHQMIQQYGSRAAEGAFPQGIDAVRNAWRDFPAVPNPSDYYAKGGKQKGENEYTREAKEWARATGGDECD